MGAVSPIVSVLPSISTAVTALGALNSKYSLFNKVLGIGDSQERRQLAQAQALQQQLAMQKYLDKRAVQKEELAQAESDRLGALRRAVARQRAKFGAQGVGSSGGSSDAVLLGIFDESEAEKSERERLDTLRDLAAQGELQGRSALNLLTATQLAEKQRLERIYGGDD